MARLRKLRVYTGACFPRDHGGTQWCAVVAAYNQKDAAAIVGDSLYSFRLFWGETGNAEDIKQALDSPETLVPTQPC